eukprot:TRINITY_DN297_c0_g1_i1.p1 TRINITY_DN297_c0_g1~~TRINITY_DN297_c0_g1_i1.p1  ORF type:complete len:74 (+),score=9.66 TRINITY_DN297_c0_g1_i1:31-222(+)
MNYNQATILNCKSLQSEAAMVIPYSVSEDVHFGTQSKSHDRFAMGVNALCNLLLSGIGKQSFK